jgi:hypothetical protein
MESGRQDGMVRVSEPGGRAAVMRAVVMGIGGVGNRLGQGLGIEAVYKYRWSHEAVSETAGGRMWRRCSLPHTSRSSGLSSWRGWVCSVVVFMVEMFDL